MAADEWIFDYTDSPGDSAASPVRRTLNQVGLVIELYKDAIQFLNEPGTGRLRPVLSADLLSDARAGLTSLMPQVSNLGMNRDLLKSIQTCVQPGVPSWAKCVSTANTAAWSSPLPKNPPSTGFVSQIREADYSMKHGLRGFLIPEDARDPLWPLSMTVQLTVDNAARWEFPGFPENGLPKVLAGLSRDGKSAELTEVRQLCLLQRFFRTAYAGRLGDAFPVERLVALAQEVASQPLARTATPMWLADQSTLQGGIARDFLKDLQQFETDKGRLRQGAPVESESLAAKACVEGLSHAQETAFPKECVWPGSEEKMRNACALSRNSSKFDFEDIASCRLFALAFEADALQRDYRLRSLLGATSAPRKASDLPCAQQHPPSSEGPFAALSRVH